ncbi:MAG: hypothetical protein WCQ99_16385 [Pseudomonadota bacterium]
MTAEYDDDDDRPGWRDIDRKKDKSKHVSEDRAEGRPKSAKKEWVQKMYLKEIENLFKGKKSSKEHGIALGEIHQRAGTKKFNAAAKKYLKEYGMPDDWSTLFLLLDYKEMKVVRTAAETLKAMSKDAPLNLKEGFKSKLNIIAMTTTDDALREMVEETLQDL